MDKKDNSILYGLLCVVTLAVTLFPVSCNYIMSGGSIGEWIGRVEEIADGLRVGAFYLFPSSEKLAALGVTGNAMNSNLWFLLPGLLYRLSKDMVLSYRFFMLLLQTATLFFSMLFFRDFYAGSGGEQSAYFGVLFYMTCPYRIYLCYDAANLSGAAAWMLLPLCLWAFRKTGKRTGQVQTILIASLALAGIGYADVVFFLTVGGLALLIGLARRNVRILLSELFGTVLFLPGLSRLAGYLFAGRYGELELPLQSIMGNGYRFGEYFTSYTFRSGHPGMGLGMLFGLLTGVWLCFVRGKGERTEGVTLYAVLAGVFAVLSFWYFPWDFVQRAGEWALRLVSLIETPAVFAGFSYAALCVVCAGVMGRIEREEKAGAAAYIPLFVLIACLGLCIYRCNVLTYARMPLEL